MHRRLVAMLVIGALGCRGPAPTVATAARAVPGLEVLLTDSAELVRGARVGLLTNQAGLTRDGTSGVDFLRAHGVNLVALYSPEHGFRGTAAPGEAVASSVDSATGLPIYSLYGRTPVPTETMFAGVDVVLIDLQDVGARYFTWLDTAIGVMRVASVTGMRVVLLDRPNPIGGLVQGNVLDTAFATPVGRLAVPMRPGLTLGELMRLAKADLGLEASLTVVPVAGWWRALPFDATGLPYVAPSPNLPTLEALYHYPGLCLFEGTAYSVGRGSDDPFTQIGAPWLDTTAVLRLVRSARLPGVEFRGTTFTPAKPGDGKFDGVPLAGIRLDLLDPHRYDPTRTAVHLLSALQAVHPDKMGWNVRHFDRLAGGASLRVQVTQGARPEAIMATWNAQRSVYLARREPYLIYR